MSTGPENITRRLLADPYRVDLLVERLLLHAANGDLQAAQTDLAIIQKLGSVRTFAPGLAQVASGHLKVVREARSYFMFDPTLEPALVGWSVHFLRSARGAAEHFFGPLDCCLVVELSNAISGIHHASSEVPGVGYIKLSPRSSLVEHESVIAHEVAHVYLSSGNRFVDEGVAVFFQARLNGGRIFVGTEFESMAVLDQSRDEVLPLRALLAHDGRNDVFFDRLVPETRSRQAVYAAGYALIAHVIECVRLTGLKALCAMLRGLPLPAAHPAMVAQFLGKGIEELDHLVLQSRGNLSAWSPPPSAVPESAPATTLIWSPLSAFEVTEHIALMRRQLVDEPARTAAKSALARLLVRRVLENYTKTPAADVAEARSLVYELNLDIGCMEKERLLLEGWLAIAQTHTTPSVAIRIVNWERSMEVFRRALNRFPDDPEVLCATATLHLRGPEQYGANRALARTCLESARQCEGWSELVQVIERNYGNAIAG